MMNEEIIWRGLLLANPTPELGIQNTCPEELTCLAEVSARKDVSSDDDDDGGGG